MNAPNTGRRGRDFVDGSLISQVGEKKRRNVPNGFEGNGAVKMALKKTVFFTKILSLFFFKGS